MVENSRSSVVKGAPSCQVVPGRSRHVVCMVPSAPTVHEPSSTDGTLAASNGTRTPSLVTVERLGLTSSTSSARPGVLMVPELSAMLSPGGTPPMAMVTRFGAWLGAAVELAPPPADGAAPEEDGPAQPTSTATSNQAMAATNERRPTADERHPMTFDRASILIDRSRASCRIALRSTPEDRKSSPRICQRIDARQSGQG